MKSSDYIRCDTTFPPQAWDVAWSASYADDGALVVDTQPLTVQPGKWPDVREGYQFLVASRMGRGRI